jgi:hypothetical protein
MSLKKMALFISLVSTRLWRRITSRSKVKYMNCYSPTKITTSDLTAQEITVSEAILKTDFRELVDLEERIERIEERLDTRG